MPRPTRERGSGWSPRSPRRATTLPFSRFQRLGTSKASTWKRCDAAPRAGGGLPGRERLDHAARARIARRGWAPPRRSNVRIRRGGNGSRLPPPRQAATRSEGAASPASSLAVLQHPDALGVEVEPTRFGEQARGRLLERLLGQIKGAPVDRHEVETPDVGQHAQRLLGRRVARLHDHGRRSEEHTSELQSPDHLVCRLLLEKKKKKKKQQKRLH